MATVNKRPSGKWQATVRRDGRSQSKSFSKRADAVKWAREAEIRAEHSGLQDSAIGTVSIITLGQVLERYRDLSEGSLLLQFLHKLQNDRPGSFTLDVERLSDEVDAAWREDVANALTVLSIPSVEDQAWTHNAQLKKIKKHSECASIGHELRKFKDSELYGVNLNTVMMTCARDLWHGSKSGQNPKAGRLAKHTRMFGHPVKVEVYNKIAETYEDKWSTTGVTFVPNTTRGTNAH